MIRFASPWLLLGLIAIPLLIWRHVRAQRRGRRSVSFSDTSLFAGIRPSTATRLRHLPILMRFTALLLFGIAVARPQTGSRYEEALTRGIDLVLTVDNSTSMAAEDFKPKNRLAVAKESVHRFIEGRKNDRIGLVVFSGRGYTRCPLTLDYTVLGQLLSQVEMATQDEGTAIGMGLVTAINRLRDSDAKSKVVILLTDGRNNRGEIDPTTAADLAATLGIRVYTIGVGSKGEVPYPVSDPFFGKRYVYLKADIDDETLTAVAKATGGQYFRATDTASLKEIFRQIDALEKTEIKVRHYVRYAELFPWFVGPGLILFALDQILGATRLRRIP